MNWYFTVTSDKYGAKDYGPYDTEEDAQAGIQRLSTKAFALDDGLGCTYTLPWQA